MSARETVASMLIPLCAFSMALDFYAILIAIWIPTPGCLADCLATIANAKLFAIGLFGIWATLLSMFLLLRFTGRGR